MDISVQLALKIAASLAIGLLIGLERQWARKDAGVRTFALVALLGTCAWLIAPALAFAQFGLVVLVILLVNAYAFWESQKLQITTSVALALTNVLGIALGGGNFFLAFAGAVTIVALLSWKTELLTLSGKLTEVEIRGALLLVFISVVVYPLLPSQSVDPWKILNLRSVWLTVILVSWLKFINYILLRQFGERGIRYSSLLGGLVNSAAMALFLGQEVQANAHTEKEAPANMLLAGTAMIFRNWLLVLLFSLPQGLTHSLPTVIVLVPVMLLAGGMAGLALLRTRHDRSRVSSRQSLREATEKQPEREAEPVQTQQTTSGQQAVQEITPARSEQAAEPVRTKQDHSGQHAQPDQGKQKKQLIKSPLALGSVFGFGLLFLSLTVVSGAARVLFGSLGFLVVVVVGALASAASSAVLVGQELTKGLVGGTPAAIAMFLATVVGLLENVVIFWLVARKPATGTRMILFTLPAIAIGVLMVFVIRVLPL